VIYVVDTHILATGLIYKNSMAREVFILTEDDTIKSSGILPIA
jgi:hypothetical protein